MSEAEDLVGASTAVLRWPSTGRLSCGGCLDGEGEFGGRLRGADASGRRRLVDTPVPAAFHLGAAIVVLAIVPLPRAGRAIVEPADEPWRHRLVSQYGRYPPLDRFTGSSILTGQGPSARLR